MVEIDKKIEYYNTTVIKKTNKIYKNIKLIIIEYYWNYCFGLSFFSSLSSVGLLLNNMVSSYFLIGMYFYCVDVISFLFNSLYS